MIKKLINEIQGSILDSLGGGEEITFETPFSTVQLQSMNSEILEEEVQAVKNNAGKVYRNFVSAFFEKYKKPQFGSWQRQAMQAAAAAWKVDPLNPKNCAQPAALTGPRAWAAAAEAAAAKAASKAADMDTAPDSAAGAAADAACTASERNLEGRLRRSWPPPNSAGPGAASVAAQESVRRQRARV